MAISFKVSKKGTRFRPKPKPQSPSFVEDVDRVDAPSQLPNVQPPSSRKRSVDDTQNDGDIAGILDAEVSIILSIFPDGYTIKTPSEANFINQNAAQNDPQLLCPYNKTSESLFAAIECGRLPADFLDDTLFKYSNGTVVCEVRDYRKNSHEQGVNGLSTVSSPSITKLSLKMSLNNVVMDIDQFSDISWTYGDIMEAESRILKALKPTLCLDPTPNLNRLCKETASLNLNLNIPGIRRKRLKQMYGPEKSNLMLEKSTMEMQKEETDCVYLGTRNVGKEKSDGGLSLIMSFVDSKKGNQDGQLSPMENLNKRHHGNQQQQIVNQKQSIEGGIQYHKGGMQNQDSRPIRYNSKQGQVNCRSNMSGPLTYVGKEIDTRIIKRFSRIQMWTERLQLNHKKKKIDKYKTSTNFPTKHLTHFLLNDHNHDMNSVKDETCKMRLSKSVVGGSTNVCKIRVLNFVSKGNGVRKLRSRLILSEKQSGGNVAMHFGKIDDFDYLANEELLPTLPNSYTGDLFAEEFCSQMWREGYRVESDHVEPKPMNMVESTGGQHNSGHGLLDNDEIQQIMESVSRVSMNEVAKPSNGGTHNMHPHVDSLSYSRLLPSSSSRSHQSEPQPSLYQQQELQMIASNHLNSNIQQLGNNYNVLPQEVGILQLKQEAENQKKNIMMMMKMGQLTPADVAAIMADKMVQQSKLNVTGGQSGNFSGHSMMDYGYGYGMNPMQQTNVMAPYMNQQQQVHLPPPQQLHLLPHHQPSTQQNVMYYGGGTMGSFGGLNLG